MHWYVHLHMHALPMHADMLQLHAHGVDLLLVIMIVKSCAWLFAWICTY